MTTHALLLALVLIMSLVVILGYKAVQKLADTFTENLRANNDLQLRTVITLEKCVDELEQIKQQLFLAGH
jgi:Tfp pilus assembly protein PilO